MRSPFGSSRAGNPSPLERALPPDSRHRLETARLELRALFRAADQLGIGQDLPEELRRLFELDADFAEALHVMDLSPRTINIRAMLRDTEAAFSAVPEAWSGFLAILDPTDRTRFEKCTAAVRESLPPQAAYIDIPGRDSNAG